MIAFIGSVFSPYYHWAGRRDPENHVAFNVALYGPQGHAWAMTERGRAQLKRDRHSLAIGKSAFRHDGSDFTIAFDEIFLPWPGQRLLPQRMRGEIRLIPDFLGSLAYGLDPGGYHSWQPVAPSGRVTVSCDALPDGGWSGTGYHDMNQGNRPLEKDFSGWDWARGDTREGRTVISHAYCLGQASEGRLTKIAINLAKAGISIMTTAPADCPAPPVAALRAAGVNVCMGSDGIRDAWSPFGNGDMLDRAMMIAYRANFRHDHELALAFEMVTDAGARVLGLPDYGLRVGGPADFMAVEAETLAEAVATRRQRKLVVKAGRVIAQDGALLS